MEARCLLAAFIAVSLCNTIAPYGETTQYQALRGNPTALCDAAISDGSLCGPHLRS